MNSSAPGRGGHWSGYQRLDNQAASASRWSHDVKHLPSGRGRRLANDEVCYEPRPSQRSVTSHQSFDSLVNSERFRALKEISDHFGKHYQGRAHGKFATEIKDYTTNWQRPLNLCEQSRLMPWLAAWQSPEHWNWRSLTTVFHSLTAAGAFTPRPDQAVTNAQATSLTGLLGAVRHYCQQKTDDKGIDVRGLVDLLWVVAKLIDSGRTLTLEMTETVTVLLPHVVVLKEQFIPQHISILLWAVAKLVENSQALVTEFEELLVVLLTRVHDLKAQFNAWGIASLLWAVAKLVDNGYGQTTALNEAVVSLLPRVCLLKEQFIAQALANLLWALAKLVDNNQALTADLSQALTALLSRVIVMKEQFNPQHISNLLWAMAKLVDKMLLVQLDEAVAALLPRVRALAAQLKSREVSNLLWAMAKLVDSGQALTPALKETVAVLLPPVRALKAHFKPQEVSNLLWSMAKLVDSGQALTPGLQESVAALLPYVNELKEKFVAQGIANLIWAVAKLVDSGQALTPGLKESVAALLPHVSRLKDKFIAQGIANLLWAGAKLVVHGLELTPEFNGFLTALLPRVNTLKGQFIVQSVANLLWAMAKLVDNGYEWTPMLKEAVVSVLPSISTYEDQLNPQHIANLLWSMAKLVDNGLELTPEFNVALAILLPFLRTYKEQFIPHHVATVLWAMGALGDFVVTAATDAVVESMLRLSDNCLLFTRQELVMSLWGLLVCRARLYLVNNISEQNDTLEYLIDRLFSYLEHASIDHKQGKSVMALAACWLGRACPVDPHYQTANSATQSVFYAQLQSALPSLQIEQEKSVHSLPPVDLLLPEHRIAIEIQGPSHYIGRDFQTRNGSTLLKTALLQKAGYYVLEIPVRHLNHHDLAEVYIEQIQRQMIVISAGDGIRQLDISCTDRGGEFFSA